MVEKYRINRQDWKTESNYEKKYRENLRALQLYIS